MLLSMTIPSQEGRSQTADLDLIRARMGIPVAFIQFARIVPRAGRLTARRTFPPQGIVNEEITTSGYWRSLWRAGLQTESGSGRVCGFGRDGSEAVKP